MTRAGRLLAVALLLLGASCDAGGRRADDAHAPPPAAAAETPLAPAVSPESANGAASAVSPTSSGETKPRPPAPPGAAPRAPGGATPATSRATTTTVPKAGACPQPRTCPIYKIMPGVRGWRPGPDGVARVPFHLDLTVPPESGVTAEQIRDAYFRAIKAWEAASPRVRFVYQGDATGRVSVIGDGVSQFAYGYGVQHRIDHEGYLIEADVVPVPTANGDAWTPCDQRDGSCTDTRNGKTDLQDVLTHELGHTIGLADLADTPQTHLLTMQHEGRVNQRFRNTLALGEVLGVRHLYPTDEPLPYVYDP